MHGSNAGFRAAGRLPGSASRANSQLDPAWSPWVRLLEVVLAAVDDPAWLEAVPDDARNGDGGHAPSAPDTPLLHEATLRPDARRLDELVRDLARAAAAVGSEAGASLVGPGARELDAVALVWGAIAGDADMLERQARDAAADPGALHVVAQLAAVPLLHACATRLRDRVPRDWSAGYCPVCGAWPTVAELRGLDRSRRLRCGRCAADWAMPILHCPFCHEVRHDRLGSLLPEAGEPTKRVDVCKSCKGYVKTFSTLRALSLRSLLMEDVASVEYDVAAHERGYERPQRPGFELEVAIEARAGSTGDAPTPADGVRH